MISVIVPVYKVPESLLQNCILSLRNQVYDDCEFIIVDDGSPDGCGTLIDSMTTNDDRFRVFHTENHGVSAARNFGLDKVRGNGVLFVDGDDHLVGQAIRALADQFDPGDTDVLVYGFQTEQIQSGMVRRPQSDAPPVVPLKGLSSIDVAEAIVRNSDMQLANFDYAFGSPWGKLISTEFLRAHSLRFPIGISKAQDRIFTADLFAHSPRLSFSQFRGYAYVQHPASVCQRFNPKMDALLVETTEALILRVRKSFPDSEVQRFDNSLPYFITNFAFSTIRLKYIHTEANVVSLSNYLSFRRFCKMHQNSFQACRKGFFESRAKRFSLELLKCRMYLITYVMLAFANAVKSGLA